MTTTERTERDVASRMTEAAGSFLDALDGAQRDKASFAFDDLDERTSWAYFPRDHHGLPLLEMTVRQQKLAHALMAGALSLHAYAKVTTIIGLESVLNEIEGRTRDAVRDPGRYFLSIFGSPGDERWSWRLEGHHVNLNFTFVAGEIVSPTPIFLGANPAEVGHGGSPATRPCGEEEDAARELLASLDGEQRSTAIMCDAAPPDFVLTNMPQVPDAHAPGDAGTAPFLARLFEDMPQDQRDAVRFERNRPLGLAAAAMTPSQRKTLGELIDVYVSRLPGPLALLERERIDVDIVHFAWAGETERRRGHYYRLQGGSFVVEYDNTQDEANHVHSVWRDAARDFGYDALRAHVAGQH